MLDLQTGDDGRTFITLVQVAGTRESSGDVTLVSPSWLLPFIKQRLAYSAMSSYNHSTRVILGQLFLGAGHTAPRTCDPLDGAPFVTKGGAALNGEVNTAVRIKTARVGPTLGRRPLTTQP